MAFQQQQQWGGPVFDQGAVMPGAAAFPPLMGGPGADFPSLDGSLDHGAPEIPDDVRPGDWPCPNCGTNCFASKAFCFKCKTSKPGSEGMAPFQGGGKGGSGEVRPGDWICPGCQTSCFASKSFCFRCNAPKPFNAVSAPIPQQFQGGGKGGRGGGNEVREGDWACPMCNDHVFAFKTNCRCGCPKPGAPAPGFQSGAGGWGKGDTRPGDWACSNCNANVFASRDSCFKCGTPKGPTDGSFNDYQAQQQHGWEQPAGKGGGGGRGETRPGDWTCPGCNANVFASKSSCFKCGHQKPGGGW